MSSRLWSEKRTDAISCMPAHKRCIVELNGVGTGRRCSAEIRGTRTCLRQRCILTRFYLVPPCRGRTSEMKTSCERTASVGTRAKLRTSIAPVQRRMASLHTTLRSTATTLESVGPAASCRLERRTRLRSERRPLPPALLNRWPRAERSVHLVRTHRRLQSSLHRPNAELKLPVAAAAGPVS
jgi:hypothetical protein